MIGGRNLSQLLIVCVSAIIYQMPGAEAIIEQKLDCPSNAGYYITIPDCSPR